METFGNKKSPKIPKKFDCNVCMYSTYNFKDFKKHINTIKHKNNEMETNGYQKIPKISDLATICDCGKEYFSRTGLWKHRKTCGDFNNKKHADQENNIQINFDTNFVLDLVNKNQEFQKEMFLDMQNQFLEFMKDKIGDNNVTNNITNSNNKTFNLQVFLNETCKDAMNISDFIESVKLQVSDLENVGRVGYIEGISNIIIKNLQALEVEKRPVHCTDQKREVMYVKEDNIWEKEDEANKKLRKLVRAIAHKNICMLKAFRDKYPDCEQYDSKKGSQYNKLVIEAMGGKGDDDYEKNTKIIKKIAKAVGIDKN
jgi:hypothetical protein